MSEQDIDAVLDAALDELDDDDDDGVDEIENHEPQSSANVETKAISNDAVVEGGQPIETLEVNTGTKAELKDSESLTRQKNQNEAKESKKKQAPKIVAGPPLPPAVNRVDIPDLGNIEGMMELLQAVTGQAPDGENEVCPNEEFLLGHLLQEMQSQIASEVGQDIPKNDVTTAAPPSGNNATKTTTKTKKGDESGTSGGNEVNQAISELLEDMAEQTRPNSGPPSDQTTERLDEEQMLKDMMAQFESFGADQDFNADSVINGMMEQLLSKELMYEPMKQVTEKFPSWLKRHKETLPEQEYRQRCKQYEYFQKLVRVYENDPNNVQGLMILMQEVQEYGQPPPEIIQDIAPGLQLDADGMPVMDGSAAGLPFLGGNNDECCIM